MKENEIGFFESDIVEVAYKKEKLIILDNERVKNKLCYIFFSGNGLYYPNTSEVFYKNVIENSRYEWMNIAQSKYLKKVRRKIFVRDIYKQWYVKGISQEINSVDKLLEELKRLTNGFEIVTVGSSAGGYMAALAAVKLEALRCFDFSGQFFLESVGGKFVDEAIKQDYIYKNITKLIEDSKCIVYYFVPFFSKNDEKQRMCVKNFKNVKEFDFKSDIHATTMFPGNMPFIISLDEKRLDRFYRRYENKKIDRVFFLCVTMKIRGISVVTKLAVDLIKHKIFKEGWESWI